MIFEVRSPFVPHPFEAIRSGVFPSDIHEPVYDGWVRKFNNNQSIKTDYIEYDSDGYRVNGLYIKPHPLESGDTRPLIIFNRGGRGAYGMLNVLTINNLLAPLVEKGYLLLASNYRGVNGAAGEDEFGGAEVQDIVSLEQYGRKLQEWDAKNIFFFGWSRGGMMTLLALKQGAQVNACALGAPLVDLTLSTGESSKREDWLTRVLPNYEEEGYAALEKRSAPYWLSALNKTPLLLMHGDADTDVSILHSRQFAQRLKERSHVHELVEYPGGNHYLNRERSDVLERVDRWFQRYMRP